MSKVLITGSQGYIGSVLTEYLTRRGYDCIGFDTGFFADSLLYNPPSTTTITRDVRTFTSSDLQGVDAVVHLAGISNDPLGELRADLVYDPTRKYTLEVARLCKEAGVRFIFASSCSIYGIGDGSLLDENSQVNPQTFYSLNKLQIEQDLQSLSDATFSPIALRFATIYGPSPRIRFDVVVNMLVGMAVATNNIVLNSDGQSWRPNLHIEDACQSVHSALQSNYNDGSLLALNVGSDQDNVRILDIAKTIQELVPGCSLSYLSENPELDKEGLIRDRKIKDSADTRTYKVSFDRIHTVFPSFKCNYALRSGISGLVDCLRSLPLTYETFKSRGFYRLQQLEYLHSNQLVDDNLFWTNQNSSVSPQA